jgi:uncharacterized protein YqjF (DUF2071 family)
MEGAMLTRREFLELNANAITAATLAAGCGVSAAPVLNQTAHRPWPLPQKGWRLAMRWHDLLFLHWPVHPDLMRPLIPRTLELETFDGWCWIGVVPFRMSGVRPRYVPIPLAFPELNVRTYVSTPGRSGVWFFSLDAASWLSVRVARYFGLPYYDAKMKVEPKGNAVDYESVRVHEKAAPAEFKASYRPTGPVYHAVADTFDHWLTERYCLYGAVKPDRVVYGEIHHPPWPLQEAEVELRANTMTQPIGIKLPDTKPICHFARYQEVVAWPIVPIKRVK